MVDYVDITVSTHKTYRVRKDSMSGIDPKYLVEYRQFDQDCPEPIKIEHGLAKVRPVPSGSERKE